ncbi:MAG: sodium-translocating pyrophosphatase [Chloroflexota bacterium]
MPNLTAFEHASLWAILAVAILGLGYAGVLTLQILREDRGTAKMQQVAGAIRTGANAYLNRQFRTIGLLIIVLTVALYLSAALTGAAPAVSWGRAAAFLMGSLFSATVGFIGMNMAVQGNVRVTSAAGRSFGDALRIAYRSGTITGMLTDGLGLLGGTLIFIIYRERAPEVLLGFGFGGTLLALFMRVGGGIYTKAADVGADLVGKVEQGIPEDDPRNAAVIADLVGDNVGDCAGMAADIFESYEVTMVSAMILGLSVAAAAGFSYKWVIFPLIVRAIGVFSSIIGTYFVRSAGGAKDSAMKAISRGFNLSAVISIIGFFVLAKYYVHDLRVFGATLSGVVLAVAINQLTEHFTATNRRPVDEIADSTTTGPATVILAGLASGYESSVWAITLISGAILSSVLIFAGSGLQFILYGVALCGIGMLTLTGNNVSMDAFGPIADNANGIGEMAGAAPAARQIMADLDAVGNTTKAITKGVAIGSAVIAAVSLFGSFVETVIKSGTLSSFSIDIADPYVFIGLLIGGAVPFLFSSLTIRAVQRAASLIVQEVRRQFRLPGIMEGKAEPDYARAVLICTTAAQKELAGLGVLAVLMPVVIGFGLHERALGGFLGGVILSGQLLAVFMSNAGGAWDNGKKTIEDGLHGGKGSDAHKASVVGDTVGDPLKDTAGPALNPMIKVINMVSLLIAPLVVQTESQLVKSGVICVVALVAVSWAVLSSKKPDPQMSKRTV